MRVFIKFTCLLLLLFGSGGLNILKAQWQQQPFPTKENLWKVRFADSLNGWVLADSAIYNTNDGGATWVIQDTTSHFGTTLTVLNRDVVYYSSTKIHPRPYSRRLRRTMDGGMTWQTVDTSFYFYFDVEFATDQIGFAACGDINYQPAFLKTTDGGATWRTIDYAFSPANFEINEISFIDDLHGWAVTHDAFIFNTIDGGETWALQDSIRTLSSGFLPLRDIFFTTADSGWTFGGLGGTTVLAKTIDGGQTWLTQTWQGSSGREIYFLNSQMGWFVGAVIAPPFYWHTTDGGQSWLPQTYTPVLGGEHGIESISMINANLGWAVGSFPGRLYKFDTNKPTPVNEKDELPVQFTLSPNFPNPFNPATTIEYTLPFTTEIKLAVYDLLGKEVAVLDRGFRQAGGYRTVWHGSDQSGRTVASGMYFYALTAGSQRIIRKLTFIQ